MAMLGLFLLAASYGLASSFSPETRERVRLLVNTKEIDGYSFAEVHAMEKDIEIGQSKRDLEAHAHDSSSSKNQFSLHLDNGQRLDMTLHRRSTDFSQTRFFVHDHNGKRELPYEPDDCFFSGPVEGEKGAMVTLAICHGNVHGAVYTNKRYYEIHNLKEETERRSLDDIKRVLVTWKGEDPRNALDTHDGIEPPVEEDDLGVPAIVERDATRVTKASTATRTVEIANFLDSYYVSDVGSKLGLFSDSDIINLQLAKWGNVADSYATADQYNLDIKLVLSKLEIWRTNPSWYRPGTKIEDRMRAICARKKNSLDVDQMTISTGQTSDRNRVGLAWIGTVCTKPNFRCAAVRSSGNGFHTEVHELGHSLGLNHDGRMDECNNDGDQKGFMGGNRQGYFRKCYADVFHRVFPKMTCLLETNYAGPIVEQF